MNFIKYIFSALAILSIDVAHAQDANWAVEPSAFQYSMNIVAFLNVNGELLTSEQDKVAAFVNGDVRGVASVVSLSNVNRHLAYLTVYANSENEVLTFKIFNSSTHEVVDIDLTLDFIIDAQIGNVFQALSLASPQLSTEANIEEFKFSSINTISFSIVDDAINILLPYKQPLTDLNPEFIISQGAKMYRDDTLQMSGQATVDFTDTVTYSVLSEDESVLNNFKVVASTQRVEGNESEFTSTNVVTANNDGKNDTWVVQNVFLYNNYNFQIMDVNGRIVYESIGYNNDWDGTYEGKQLDRGKYYFFAKSKDTGSVAKGSILLLR